MFSTASRTRSTSLPGPKFSIQAEGAVEIALPSAPSDETGIQPYVIAPAQVANGVWGAANFKRYFHQILTLAAQPELPARRLIVGETFTPSGNWSTYPPHKHQVDDLPREAYHEEMYYFKVNPGDGFGICHYYNEEGEEENFTVRDNSIHMMPRGYHTVVCAPGYTTYYLWFLAGNQRVQATVDDPAAGLGQPHGGDVERTGALDMNHGSSTSSNSTEKWPWSPAQGRDWARRWRIALAEAGADIAGLDRQRAATRPRSRCRRSGRRFLPL